MRNVLLVLRTKRNLSQQQVADLLFISRSTYNKWENDIGEVPHSKLFLISEVYQISIQKLILLVLSENNLLEEKSGSENITGEDFFTLNEKLNSIIKILDEKRSY
ncbi:helix-turn-helix transcriptional regulator [Pedobacter sp. W3I1]|uniref:helix-turn-helix transcriptional regulator n=1 Tax=Pedobacter sp. W3I1 TaxID=3042291 RepID=UPI0027D7F459|nr:helix-turn-helix transcriptional regulator [Pedobacter sp. W3I1]